MQQPQITINGTTYQALPASYAALIPSQLADCAEWTVTACTGGDRTGTPVGWIADAPRGAAWQVGQGPFMAIFGGGTYGPPLAYLSHARSSRQGLRLLAEAHQASLARPPRQPRFRGDRAFAGLLDAFFNGARR